MLAGGARIAALLLLLLVAAVVWFRRPIVEYVLVRQLGSMGLAEVELEISRFDFGSIELRDLALGGAPDLSVARVEADFSPIGLWRGQLDGLRISDVELRGNLDDSGLSLGSLDPLLAPGEAEPSSGGAVLPSSSIEVDGVHVALATPNGPLDARLSARSRELEGGRLEAELELSGSHPMTTWSAQLEASGTTTALSGAVTLEATAAADPVASVSTRGASITARATFQVDGSGAVLRLDDCATLHIDELGVEGLVKLSRPLELCLRSGSEPGLRISADASVEARIEIEAAPFAVDLQETGGSRHLSGQLPSMVLRATRTAGALEAAITTAGGRLELSDPAIGARGIVLDARLEPGAVTPRGQLRIRALADAGVARDVPELGLTARFGPGAGADQLVFEAEISDAKRNLVVAAKGSHDLALGVGRVTLSLQPIYFCPGKLQPGDLLETIRDVTTATSGWLEGVAALRWDGKGFSPELDLAIGSFGTTSGLAVVEQLNAAIRLDESGSPPHQLLSVGRIDFGIELTDGLIDYQVRRDGTVAIDSATWKFAGGVLTTTGEVDPRSANQELSFQVQGLDLAKLLALVNLDGLSGSGTLEGRLPIVRKADEIEIRGGRLRSSPEGGVVRYRADSGTANLGVADQQFATVLAVLDDFHFELLEIELDGSASGEVAVGIHLKGANPSYQDGHPVDFNLSLQAQLSDLLRAEELVYHVPDAIEARLQAFSGSRAVNSAAAPCVYDR